MPTDSSTDSALSKRVTYWRKTLARGRVGGTPTKFQRNALDRAAKLSAIAEAALADASIPLDIKIRADGAAHRARVALDTLLAASKPSEPSLGDILREAATTDALVAGARR